MQKPPTHSLHITNYLFLFVLIGLLFCGNYYFVRSNPGGTDFLYRWLPTRLVFFEGYDNPYGANAEYQVELMHHGHAHQEGETPGIFAYPYYTMFVFLPFALTDNFIIARSAWMTAMMLAHIGIVFYTLKMLSFSPGKILGLTLIITALFPADFAQPLIDGNPSSLAAFFAVLALFFIQQEKDILAGIFLALSTIKPQLVILFFTFVWFWAFFNRRRNILLSSALTLSFLLGLSFLMQPDWVTEFIKDLQTYTGVAQPSTPYAIMSFWMPVPIAAKIAIVFSLASIIFLTHLAHLCYKKPFAHLFLASSLVFVLMPLTGITSAKSNYIGMFPAIILLVWYVVKQKKIKEHLATIILFIWNILSWVFFVGGRSWEIWGSQIYFIDFYPLPFLLLGTFVALKFYRNDDLLYLR